MYASSGSNRPVSREGLLIALTVVLALVILYQISGDRERGAVIFAASAIAAAATVLAVWNALDARAEKAAAGKRQGALAFIARWNDPRLIHLKAMARRGFDLIQTLSTEEKWSSFLADEDEHAQSVIDLLNIMEEIALAVSLDEVDEEAARRFFGSIIPNTWRRSRPFIQRRRQMTGRERVFAELESLASRW